MPSNPMSSRQQHYIPSRKLEVLKDCVAYIFDNQISEARKVNLLYFVLLLLAVCSSWILYFSQMLVFVLSQCQTSDLCSRLPE